MISKELLKKVRRIQIRTGHLVTDVFAGQYHSAFKGQGMEFHEVREYLPGDDIRAIDWNVTARMGSPFIKKYIEEREMTVMLLVDVSGSLRFGSTPQMKRDLAAEIAAVLAFSAIRNNDRVGLIMFSEDVELYVPPAKGVRHVLRVIREALYCRPAARGTRVQPAVDFLNHVTHRKTVTFVISDFFFRENPRSVFAASARRHDMIGVVTGDRRESAWPRVGPVLWEDAESGRRRLADTSDAAVRRELFRREQQRREQLKAELRPIGMDVVEVYAGEPYEHEFVKFFHLRNRRRR